MRAAGAMLISATSSDTELFVAAALVHAAVSLFWALILILARYRDNIRSLGQLRRSGIAVLHLRVISRLFPEKFAQSFLPQFADHMAFGAIPGGVLAYRRRSVIS